MLKAILISVLLFMANYNAYSQTTDEQIGKLIRGIKKYQITDERQFIEATNCYVLNSIDLGFGCRYVHCCPKGELDYLPVTIISLDGKLMEYGVNISSIEIKGINYTITNDTARNNAFLTLDNFKKKKTFFFVDHLLFEQYQKRIAAAIGAGNFITTDTDKLAYKILYDPIYHYGYGDLCGKDGIPPLGRTASYYLEKNNEPNTIRSLISGCNPEGRIFAIEVLLQKVVDGKAALTNDDKQLIRKVLNLSTKIEICDGCRPPPPKRGIDAIDKHLLALLD